MYNKSSMYVESTREKKTGAGGETVRREPRRRTGNGEDQENGSDFSRLNDVGVER